MFLAPDPDLSEDLCSDEDEDEEDEEKKGEEKEEEDEEKWSWSIGEGPAPFFDCSSPVEGKPISLPHAAGDMTPLQFFYQMVPKSIISRMVVETNRYASEKLNTVSPEVKARWKLVEEADIFRFLAILICMGRVRLRTKRDFWDRRNHEVIKYPSVAHVLPLKRFSDIKRFFHLQNNQLAAPYGSEEYDPLHKIRHLYDCLQIRFRNAWRMGTFASLDESMTNWRGKSRYKQYIRSKPVRWGYKFFCVCDPKTGFIKDFEPYVGKLTVTEEYGFCTDIVLKLAERSRLGLTKSIIVADNFYSSPTLVALLAQKGIGYIGTCQLGRRHVPRSLVVQGRRDASTVRGTAKTAFVELKTVSQYVSDATIYLCSWRDTKVANFIGSAGGLTTTKVLCKTQAGSKVEVPAPTMVKTYVERMGGVDLADQNKQRYSISATVVTRKWWFRLFTGLLDMALGNSWQLYKYTVVADLRLNHQDYLLAVADGMLAEAVASLATGHSMRSLVPPEHEVVCQRKVSRCVVCSRPKDVRKTTWMCSFCQYAMCAEKCFHHFHTSGMVISSRFTKRKHRESQNCNST